MLDFIQAWASNTLDMTLDTAPFLLFGFLLAGILYVMVPASVVFGHLGGKGLGVVLKAILIGIPMPLCSCSVIPVAESMSKKGASKQAVIGFLITAPETGADSIALSWGLLGPIYAILRPVVAFFSAIVAALLVGGVKESKSAPTLVVDEEKNSNCCSSCASTSAKPAPKNPSTFSRIIKYSFYTLMDDLLWYLVFGIVLAGFLGTAIPQIIGDKGWPLYLQYMVMLTVSLPMYICATSATPVAVALILSGISPGAALIMLTAGPASNVTTIGFIAGRFGSKVLLAYVLSIALVSIGFAMMMDTLFMPQIQQSIKSYTEFEPPAWLQWGALAVLLASLFYVIAKRYLKIIK